MSLASPQPFRAPWALDDTAIARALLAGTPQDTASEERIEALAGSLVLAIRQAPHGFGGIEDMLREFALSTPEGLALMVLAEALLRVPDAATADRLIEDKLGAGDFAHHVSHSDALLIHASAWALGISSRLVQPGETPDSVLTRLARRIGQPALRAATRQAMRLLGDHFVLGQTIEAALARAQSPAGRSFRYSFDMLGEGARTASDAERYAGAYGQAIEAIGRSAGAGAWPDRPGISVKLSALHPRYEATNRADVLRDLGARLGDLARAARAHDLSLTIDAEEADRLELSLDIFATVATDPQLAGWEGFGLAVQAYQKRAPAVIDWLDGLANGLNRRFAVRLVKGAYWDSEIKRAQERGLDDYPVFTRKAMTDLAYVACARRLLALDGRLFPQFATHNALTVATLVECARPQARLEFQRLHGMGEALYHQLARERPDLACRTYAPVGRHRELLAYLVRRLLENGANSSFVAAATDASVPLEQLLTRPDMVLGAPESARNPGIPLPRDLHGAARTNSRGVEFGHQASLDGLLREIAAAPVVRLAASIIGGVERGGESMARMSPIDRARIGACRDAGAGLVDAAMQAAHSGFRAWSQTPARERAARLQRAGDLLEARRGAFLHLLQVEAGKTLDDALGEWREAVDYCRYYARETLRLFAEPQRLNGPTGESNILLARGRGVFVAISPWNFPLAIFFGQILAGLAAGNSVVAKPAEQTPLVAHAAVRLLHEAGVPVGALHLVLGAGDIGAALVAHQLAAGVVFTGSGEVAHHIHRALAAKEGPIVPFIAETGGINAMIVDATALPEQVCDDVVASAFRSAGQRCSALRLLCIQDDVADQILDMIAGAARTLRIGDPRDPAVHIGPLIDHEAKARLEAWIAHTQAQGYPSMTRAVALEGCYFAPHIISLPDVAKLDREIFGPVLHVVRWHRRDLDRLLDAIDAKGFGLTLGIHSRIDAFSEKIMRRLNVGNIYVNRNMIGAVVGVQPFGGAGLSGTGPKAGGPNYLMRFALEQTVTVNTAAAGGNVSLMDVQA